MASRRTPCPDPQIHITEEDAGATRCCGPRPHPQIEAAEMSRRRDGNSPAAPASPLEDEDLLREILLRLPPQPSSLPRASAVCKRWLGLVTDPKFTRRFRVHHRKPPLLGFFELSNRGIVFQPILDRPDRIPPSRFDLGRCSSNGFHYDALDCRHGLILIKHRARQEVTVCSPVTGEQHPVSPPPEFKRGHFNGAVFCVAGNQGGGCHSSPFKVVLVSILRQDNRALACVYSSETGEWGNLIPTEAPCQITEAGTRVTLVGNVLYWLVNIDGILEFDLDRQNLAITVGPPVTSDFLHGDGRIIKAEDGAVGYAILAHPCFQMWQRNVNCQGVATWVPWKTIEMHNIIGLSLQIGGEIRWLGYDEDNDAIFVYAAQNVYTVQLKSMHSKKLYSANHIYGLHPFKSFYTPGKAINGGSNGAEMLHDT